MVILLPAQPALQPYHPELHPSGVILPLQEAPDPDRLNRLRQGVILL